MERLQKIIARAGLASRRQAEVWIREGRVTVNGRVIQAQGFKADSDKDKVKVDGRIVFQKQQHVIYAFHKPAGLITSIGDPQNRPNLGDLLRSMRKWERLFPVGRLDYNSSGLLLVTNHGELAFRLTHPRFEVGKVYEVKVSGMLSESDLHRIRGGVRLKGGGTAAAKVRVKKPLKNKSWLEVEVHEGRNREVRRIFEAVGYTVEKLVRIRFGPIRLGSLPIGGLQQLSKNEVESLHRAVGIMDRKISDWGSRRFSKVNKIRQ